MIRYRSLRHWRYQLMADYEVQTGLREFVYPGPGDPGSQFLFSLDRDGRLLVRSGYCWDGPSGPVWQSPSSLRPALVHDVLYQLMRIGVLPPACREVADDLFHRLCLEAGMSAWRAWYFHLAVRWFGHSAASEDEPYPAVRVAP